MEHIESFPLAHIDLTRCDKEPIHIPGSIQPHGLLFALNKTDWTIQQLSNNTEAFLGLPPEVFLYHSVDMILKERHCIYLRKYLDALIVQDLPLFLPSVKTRLSATLFDCIFHCSNGFLILEMEPVHGGADDIDAGFYTLIQKSLKEIIHTQETPLLFQRLVEEIRSISGFDRVMIYQFDENWNGSVIAEARDEDTESYMGLHFPASDIPEQARKLYSENWLRLIPNRAYQPAQLYPAGDVEPLDLSHATLRSVSPIHLEYLKNMGVCASMSVSLMERNKLWGLIACHHRSPKYMSYRLRATCELIAKALSLRLLDKAEQPDKVSRVRLKRLHVKMVENLQTDQSFTGFFNQYRDELLTLMSAQGVAVYIEETWVLLGNTPSEKIIQTFVNGLKQKAESGIYVTDCLSRDFPEAEACKNTASGMLAIAFAHAWESCLLFFRPEVMTTVHWAGNPDKPVEINRDESYLHPRRSFALWKQNVHLRSIPWSVVEIDAAKGLQDVVRSVLLEKNARELLTLNRVLETERARAELASQRKTQVLSYMSHELRTPLNAIIGFSEMLKTGFYGSMTDKQSLILENIRNSGQHLLLVVNDLLDIAAIEANKMQLTLEVTELLPILKNAVEIVQPAARQKNVQIRFDSLPPPGKVMVDPARMAQVFLNLLSNAIKYNKAGGEIIIRLSEADDGKHQVIQIQDTGIGIPKDQLPLIFSEFHRVDSAQVRRHEGAGLGLAVTQKLVQLHCGNIEVESQEGVGTTFTITLPSFTQV